MNPFKYLIKQTKWAFDDFSIRIDSKGRDYIRESIVKQEIAKLSPDDSLVYEFINKGKFIDLGNGIIQTYIISEFPQIIYPNWLYDLTNYSEPIVLSQFIKPIDPQKALAGLRNRITNLSAQYYERAEKGKVHTSDLEQAIADARSIEDAIVRGVEKLYSMTMYIKLDSSNEKLLSKSDKSLKDLTYAKQVELHQLIFKHAEGIESFLPKGVDKVGEEFYLTSSNVSSSLPFTTATLNDLSGPCPTASLATMTQGLEINEKRGEEYRDTLWRLTNKAINGLRNLGYIVENKTGFPIVSVHIGDTEKLIKTANILFDEGILVTVAPYPMMKKGEEVHRITITSANTDDEIEQLIHAFSVIKREL